MDRNLYQQCSGAHVCFEKWYLITFLLVCLFVCLYLPLCVRVSVCVTPFPRFLYTYYKRNVCVYVFLLPPSIECGPFVLSRACYIVKLQKRRLKLKQRPRGDVVKWNFPFLSSCNATSCEVHSLYMYLFICI